MDSVNITDFFLRKWKFTDEYINNYLNFSNQISYALKTIPLSLEYH